MIPVVLLSALIPTVSTLGFLHLRWSLNGTYLRWSEEQAARGSRR